MAKVTILNETMIQKEYISRNHSKFLINLYFCGIKGAIEVLGWIADPSLKALTASFLS